MEIHFNQNSRLHMVESWQQLQGTNGRPKLFPVALSSCTNTLVINGEVSFKAQGNKNPPLNHFWRHKNLPELERGSRGISSNFIVLSVASETTTTQIEHPSS